MSVRTGHGIKYWYKDFSWLLNRLNIFIRIIIGMSTQSIVELHSNPDFLLESPLLYSTTRNSLGSKLKTPNFMQ